MFDRGLDVNLPNSGSDKVRMLHHESGFLGEKIHLFFPLLNDIHTTRREKRYSCQDYVNTQGSKLCESDLNRLDIAEMNR